MRPTKASIGTVLLLIALNLLNYLDRYILNGAQPLSKVSSTPPTR